MLINTTLCTITPHIPLLPTTAAQHTLLIQDTSGLRRGSGCVCPRETWTCRWALLTRSAGNQTPPVARHPSRWSWIVKDGCAWIRFKLPSTNECWSEKKGQIIIRTNQCNNSLTQQHGWVLTYLSRWWCSVGVRWWARCTAGTVPAPCAALVRPSRCRSTPSPADEIGWVGVERERWKEYREIWK